MDSINLICLFGILSLGYGGTLVVTTTGLNMTSIAATDVKETTKPVDIQTTNVTDTLTTTICRQLYNKCIIDIDEGQSYVQVCNQTLKCTDNYFECKMKEDVINSTALPEYKLQGP